MSPFNKDQHIDKASNTTFSTLMSPYNKDQHIGKDNNIIFRS